jgi:hypothetical protein
VHKQPASPIQPIPVPARRFNHVHVDLVGPIPVSKEGFCYLLTCVDRSTRWLEAVPLRTMDAATCADAFIATWVARFGVPTHLTTDRGAQFTSALWQTACRTMGVQHVTTTAFHPQSNGMVERTHRQIKDALCARLAGAAWPDHLPWVLMGLRAAPKEDSNTSSAEMVYGAPMTLPGTLLDVPEPPAEEFVAQLRGRPAPPPTRPLTYAQVASSPLPALKTCTYVYVRRGGTVPPLQPLYVGPYRVATRSDKYYVLEIGGRGESVSIDRLKPHLGTSTVEPASPPIRGRPQKPTGPSASHGPSLVGAHVEDA